MRRHARLLAALPLLLLAASLRLAGGPGAAYQHIGDDALYLSQGLFLSTALDGAPAREGLYAGGSTPPATPLLLSLSPLLSPLRLEPTETRPLVGAREDAIMSSGGRPYALAYLPAATDPSPLAEIFATINGGLYQEGVGAAVWIEDLDTPLGAGDPAIVSLITPGGTIEFPEPIRVAYDPRVVAGPDGVEIRERSSGELVGLLRSDGVRSFAIAAGNDDPASIAVAVVDRNGGLRAWRIVNRELYPIGANRSLLFDDPSAAAHSVSAGPSGDLFLVSRAGTSGWELVAYDTVGPVAPVARTATAGPLTLEHDRSSRTSYATGDDGATWRVTGGPIVGARVVFALVAALGALFAFLLGLGIAGIAGGIGAGLLFALDPVGVATGQLAYLEQPLATFTVGSLAALVWALRERAGTRARRFALFGLLAGFAMASKWFAIPLVGFGLLLGLRYLARPFRRAALLAGSAGVTLLIIVGALAPLALLLLAPLGALLQDGAETEGVSDPRPLLSFAIGAFAGYAAIWITVALLLSAKTGVAPIEEIVMLHRQIIENATRGAYVPISAWWMWPTGLTAEAIPSNDLAPVLMIPGIVLAAGVAALVGIRSRIESLLGTLLLLLWSSWALVERHEHPYYALASSLVAATLLIATARSRPREGRIAIGVALLAPLPGGLAYTSTAPGAPLAMLLGLIGFVTLFALLRGRGVPTPLALLAWPVAALAALAATLWGLPQLALLAGAASALAAAGGWRVAPFGAAIAAGPLLSPEIVGLVGYELPLGLRPGSLLGAAPHVHPVGLLIFTVAALLLAWRTLFVVGSDLAEDGAISGASLRR